MLKAIKDIFFKDNHADKLLDKNRLRFDSIIGDKRFNFLETIYKRLFEKDTGLTDAEILDAYYKFSDNIRTNTFARGLLSIVYSLGDDIDWFTVGQFIDRRILADNVEPYGGLPPNAGQEWLKELLPAQKETVQNVLVDVIEENRKELENI